MVTPVRGYYTIDGEGDRGFTSKMPHYGALGAGVGFFGGPISGTKTAAAACAWLAQFEVLQDAGAAGKIFGLASGVVMLPGSLATGYKAVGKIVDFAKDPTLSSGGEAAWTTVEATKQLVEGTQGLTGLMAVVVEDANPAYGIVSKFAGMAKNFLSSLLDVKDIYDWVSSDRKTAKDLIDSHKDKSSKIAQDALKAYHEADLLAVDLGGVKSLCALAYHVLGFVTAFFALVISPFWALAVGGVFLVASIVSTIFSQRASDLGGDYIEMVSKKAAKTAE